MGIFQQALLTYDSMEEKCMGIYPAEKGEPLCPVSHIITSAQIEITLDADGNFLRAVAVDKSEPKIIIPATEESAGRTSSPCAHPLCDQLGYLGGHDEKKFKLYVEQLKNWANSAHSHPKLKPVLCYVKSRSILHDLVRFGLVEVDAKGVPDKEKLMVRWRIITPFSQEPEECWKDRKLFRAFIDYYAQQKGGSALCMVSGKKTALAMQHPKGVVAINGNAKLISANDSSGFTYRGRFLEDWQAATVSYEASQKAHAALRWLIANQGDNIGGRAFVCWNPEGLLKTVSPKSPLHPKEVTEQIPSDYRASLKKALLGAKERIPADAKTVIAAFDAATTGRLSLTYYNELLASDFLDRLHDWDVYCCWWLGEKIFSPYLQEIVNCAYGTERNGWLETDDRVMAQQFQRLVSCRVDRAKMPRDIMLRLVKRASMPQMYSEKDWRRIVYTACAVIQKYEEENFMEWPLDKQDRSFQFGRLLSAMERAESDYYYNAKEERQTNAIKSMAVFKQTPWVVFERVNERLENAYLPRIKPWQRNRYYKIRDEITGILAKCGEDLNAPLTPYYLMGYELQRNDFYKKNEKIEEEEI